jgi:predicted RNase H-like nuclease (RuvC/YqgF family)
MILGMDKLPSYDSFAVVITDDGETVHRGDAVSIDAIIKMANSHKVDAIALDNIFEIGDTSAIRHFVSRLYGAELVQVTGSPATGFIPLSVIGKRLGKSSGEKLAPSRSAEVCAIAATAGIGYSVRIFDPETRITLSKRRKFGTGGMSAGRYQRSMQGAILNLTHRIRSSLASKGVDFDLAFKKGGHGLVGATFNVYAPRTSLYGLVRPLRTSSINVRVSPVQSKSFEFVPIGKAEASPSKRYLIIGVDPGMVTGLAALDLNGRIIHLSSGRGITRGQITRTIADMGRALVFASDVNPPPFMVTKLASSHSALLFVPEQSIKTSEKSAIAERYYSEQAIKADDTHQRDSLAAAAKAFASYRNKLEQSISHAKNSVNPSQMDEVKASVIRGMSITDAIAQAAAPPPEPREAPKPFRGSERAHIKVLEAKLDDARTELAMLRGQLNSRDAELEELRNQLRLAKLGAIKPKLPDSYEFERRIKSLSSEVLQLRAEVEGARYVNSRHTAAIERLASGRCFAVKRSPSLSSTAVSSPDAFENLSIIAVANLERLDDEIGVAMKKAGISAVITESRPSEAMTIKMMELEIPVILLSDLEWEGIGRLLLIEGDSMLCTLAKSRSAITEHFRSSPRRVRQLFEDYRKDRWR